MLVDDFDELVSTVKFVPVADTAGMRPSAAKFKWSTVLFSKELPNEEDKPRADSVISLEFF